MLEQFPFADLPSAAGVAAAGILIRQIIEIAKKTFLPWLDAGNERKGVFAIAAVLYLAWLIAYGDDLATDGVAALLGFWATATAAIGANEAVDAAKGQVAKNVVEASGGATGSAATVASEEAVIDDSTDRSLAVESGPDLDLLVGDGAPLDDLDELPTDPAVDPGG